MEAVFLRERGNLFSSEPHQKAFYHPTKPRNLSKNEKKTCMSPAKPRHPGGSHSAAPHTDLHWDLDVEPVKNSSCDSPQFNESWPSSSESGGQAPGGWGEGGQVDRGQGHDLGDATAHTPTMATYIRRFRHAPATQRSERGKPKETFWWKQAPTIHNHFTPPKQPQGHSTPTSDSKKSVSVTPRVSSVCDESLEERAEVLTDKSSSLLATSTTTSSLPAQKYLNTLKQQPCQLDSKPEGAMSQPPPLTYPLRELPLHPEEDILYQWRLRRRLDEARREAAMAGEWGRVFDSERNRGRSEEALCSPHVCPQSSIPAQSQWYHSREEFDAVSRAQLVQQPCRASQLPNTCGGSLNTHQTVPPTSHHSHLHLLHMHSSHIPPHKHMVCDVIPCPCCGLAEEEEVGCRRGEGDTGPGAEVAHEDTTQQWREELPLGRRGGREGESEGGGGGRGRERAEPGGRTRGGGKEGGREGGGRKGRGRERGGGEKRERRGSGGEGRGEIGRHSMQHLTPCEAEVTHEYASRHTTRHRREELPLNGGGGGEGGRGRREGDGEREGGGEGRGGGGRPPVQYPSPSVLVRLKTRETSCDSVSSDECSQLSLTFSSEFEHTLTPRPGTPHSQPEQRRKRNTDLSGLKSMANDCNAPNIEPIVSQAVKDQLFSSPCSSPLPTAIATRTPSPTTTTTHTPPLRGTPTSKESLATSRGDVHPLEIPWDNDMGDKLLRVLIDKARLFEAQLWEIDRLLSVMDKDC